MIRYVPSVNIGTYVTSFAHKKKPKTTSKKKGSCCVTFLLTRPTPPAYAPDVVPEGGIDWRPDSIDGMSTTHTLHSTHSPLSTQYPRQRERERETGDTHRHTQHTHMIVFRLSTLFDALGGVPSLPELANAIAYEVKSPPPPDKCNYIQNRARGLCAAEMRVCVS